MIIYQMEKYSDNGDSVEAMVEASEIGIKDNLGDAEWQKILTGENKQWKIIGTFEVPDPQHLSNEESSEES